MTLLGRAPIDVAVAEFEDIVSLGLQSLIEEDDSLRLIAAGIPQDRLDAALSAEATDVAILNLGSLDNPSELRELHERFPDTRLLLLADNPSAAQCRQLLGFGATACLAKSTDARDALHAIYLASRGMHVLPADVDSDEEYESAGPTPPHPTRDRRARPAPGRQLQCRDRRRAARGCGDHPDPRTQHLPEGRGQLAARAALPGVRTARRRAAVTSARRSARRT
jgi:DNA-binding NarL/FixJ family response regulator